VKKPKRGRRPGTPTAARAIRRAAASAFAERGYSGATIRAIAAAAGVDPALVHHYFGTKRALFEAALDVSNVASAKRLVASSAAQVTDGERIVLAFLERWDDAVDGDALAGLLRAAATDPSSAAIVDRIVDVSIVAPAVAAIDARRGMATLRAELIAAQLIGLAWMRYVVRIEPLARASSRIVAKTYGPSLDATLVGRDYPTKA